MTRTDDTFRCCAFAIEPLAEPVAPAPVAAVVPALVVPAVPAADVVPPAADDEPDMLVSSVPVTSTFLLVFDVSSD